MRSDPGHLLLWRAGSRLRSEKMLLHRIAGREVEGQAEGPQRGPFRKPKQGHFAANLFPFPGTPGVGPVPLLVILGRSGEREERETRRGQTREVSPTSEVGSVWWGHCAGVRSPGPSSATLLCEFRYTVSPASPFPLPSQANPTPLTSEG